MLIISARDNENNRWKRKAVKTKTERNKGVTQALWKVWELSDFAVHLNFLQLICKVSLIFKSDLELALSSIFKKRVLYELKHMRLVTLLNMFFNSSFKMMASFAIAARTTASPSKFMY